MKKVLALILSALMLLSCLTVASLAEENEGLTVIQITDGTTMNGWKNELEAAVDAEIGAITIKLSGTSYKNGGWGAPEGGKGIKFQYNAASDPNNAASFDVSGMNCLVLDLYVSNAAAVAAAGFDIELGSKNGKSLIYQTRTWADFAGKELVDGWNHLEIPLSKIDAKKGDPYDPAAWDYLRIYNRDEFAAGDNFAMAVKNLGFAAGSETETPAPEAPSIPDVDIGVTTGMTMKGWKNELGAAVDAEIGAITIKLSGTAYKNGGWGAPEGGKGIKFQYDAASDSGNAASFDVSGMNYLVLDLYVSNAAAVAAAGFDIELGSKNGKSLIYQTRTWADFAGKELVDGWNHLEIPLSKIDAKKGDPYNATAWDYLRIYNRDEFAAGDNFAMAIRNVGFKASSAAADAAQEAAKAAAEVIIALYTPIADIRKGDITAENYEAVMAQLTAAADAFMAADIATQDVVNETLDTAAIERAVIKALEQYEKELAEASKPVDPVDPEPTDPADPDPTEPDPGPTDPEPTDPEQTADEDEAGVKPVVIVVIVVVVLAVVAVIVIVATKKKK